MIASAPSSDVTLGTGEGAVTLMIVTLTHTCRVVGVAARSVPVALQVFDQGESTGTTIASKVAMPNVSSIRLKRVGVCRDSLRDHEMKILLATDGSDYAIHAARLLSRLSCSEPIEIIVLTAVYLPLNQQTMSVRTWYPEWRDEERNRLNHHHQQLRSLLGELNADVHTLQVDGQAPAHCILSEAKKADVDLIVLGARGHSTISRILLGSVSDNVATHAHCSVLVVRGDEESWTTDEAIRMTVAYDHSPAANQAVHDLKRFQWSGETSAQLLSVVRDTNVYVAGYFGTEYVAELEHDYEEQADTALEHAEKQLPDLSQAIQKVDAQVIRGEHTGESILNQAENNQSNLIVIGSSGHGVLSELILGSTSKYVLRQAPCSVWIARAPAVKEKSADHQPDSAFAT